MKERVAVVGLGYVGLPVAVAIAEKWPGTVGFDISRKRVEALQAGHDWTGEVDEARLKASNLSVHDNAKAMAGCTFFIVTVPTPIDGQNRPDLSPLSSACELVGPYLRKGAVVVFESTVYPGVTEDFCGPLLEQHSGLKRGAGFKLGYSPERINPGDHANRFEKIMKIVAGEDEATLDRLKAVYGSVVQAGLYPATSIKVAEAAKVLENTQRDLNIALMNELSLILDRMDIRTHDVLAAAGTKWNFLKFTPGLVGGHCIGVDPYYLTAAAEGLGYRPEVILAGRRVNDGMGAFVAQKTVKLMAAAGIDFRKAKVGIFGVTFKENVPDIRNSKVFDIVREFESYGIKPLLCDPIANDGAVEHEYGLKLSNSKVMKNLDAVILAVSHSDYVNDLSRIHKALRPKGIFVDIKSVVGPDRRQKGLTYWSL